MKRSNLLVSSLVSLVLGMGVLILLNGSGLFTASRSIGPVAEPLAAAGIYHEFHARVAPVPSAGSDGVPARVPSTITPTPVPLQVGMRKGEDLETILLLYDSTQVNAFDLNFCKIAEQDGLFCRKVDLSRAKMSDDLLRDQQGSYCRLIGISADTLLKPPALLDGEEIAIIKSAVEKEGISLFVGKAKKYPNANLLTATNPLTELTDGAIIGIRQPRQAPHTGWSVSASAPEITGLFTGQVIPAASPPRREFSPVISGRQRVTTLITSTNEVETYPIFVRCQKGSGSIFIDAGASAESLETSQVRDVFDQEDFSEITPLMMTLRYAMGNRAWHVNRDYASLGEGMPVPVKPFGLLNFTVALD